MSQSVKTESELMNIFMRTTHSDIANTKIPITKIVQSSIIRVSTKFSCVISIKEPVIRIKAILFRRSQSDD